MEADEPGTIARLKAVRGDLAEPLIVEHHGRIVKLMGNGKFRRRGPGRRRRLRRWRQRRRSSGAGVRPRRRHGVGYCVVEQKPDWTLESEAAFTPAKAEYLRAYLDDLRKAGLPET